MAAAAEGRFSRRLASPAIRALLRRRLAELGALLLALGGLALLVALVTYNAHDPSPDTASAARPANLAGPLGATLADLLLQGFGLAGALPGLAMLAWAWRIAAHRPLALPLRLAALLAGLPVLAAVLAGVPLDAAFPTTAGLGGAVGLLLAGSGLAAGRGLLGPPGAMLIWALALLLALVLTLLALGLSRSDWRSAGAQANAAARYGLGGGLRVAGFGSRVGGWLAALVAPLARLLAPREPREPAVAMPLGDHPAYAPPAHPPAYPPAADAPAFDQEADTLHRVRPDRAVPQRRDPRPNPIRGLPPMPEDGAPGPKLPQPAASAPPPPVAPRTRIAAPAPRPAPPRQESLPLGEAGWQFPPLSLLKPPPARGHTGPSEEALQANARLLESVLADYGVQGTIREIRPGPVVTLYELEPAPGIRSARVIGLADDVARSLSVTAVRIATVSGRNAIGIEVPNAKRDTVYLSELLGSDEWIRHSGRLVLALGKDISGAPVTADLARMPHLLIAGTTGSGKSVGVNAMILSLLFRLSPEQCRLILIDPKMLELSVYDGIPHLMAPVVTEPAKAVTALKWTVREMERRYRAMSQLGVRNVGGYNERVAEAAARGEVVTRRVQTGFDPETGRPIFEEQPLALESLPFLVVIIDEMADLMMVAGKEIEAAVQRLAQMARAAGIHVIMATQRPSVDVITGTIKANFPTRISFQVISKFDSRTILGEQGAEQLLGQGDLLHMQGGGRIARVHGPFVADAEVEEIVAFLRQQGEPAYLEEVTEPQDDDTGPLPSGIAGASDSEKGLFDQAVALVAREGKASTSFIQRHLQIGYNRAAKLIEQMEKEGIVSAANHVGKREVLVRRTHDD
jgi:S-DNA-T family DNA segregation ATPase FtsK/SpoIIIE